jgi:hypothetical protein
MLDYEYRLVGYFSALTKQVLTLKNNEKLKTLGSGKMVIYLNKDCRDVIRTITHVMHVPGTSTKLLSVSRMVEKD